MPYVNTTRFCIFCLFASFISSVTQAGVTVTFSNTSAGITTNRPWGNIEAFKPGLKYQNPPATPYIGAAPATGWYPAQQSTAAAVGNTEPRVEIEPFARGIYEQQNIVYTVRVVSSGNLKTLNPILPNIEGAALELVDGPRASARQTGRNREIINEYRFKLIDPKANAGRAVIMLKGERLGLDRPASVTVVAGTVKRSPHAMPLAEVDPSSLRSRFPEAWALVRVSRVGFDRHQSEAVFFASFHGRDGSKTSQLIVARRNRDGWSVEATY